MRPFLLRRDGGEDFPGFQSKADLPPAGGFSADGGDHAHDLPGAGEGREGAGSNDLASDSNRSELGPRIDGNLEGRVRKVLTMPFQPSLKVVSIAETGLGVDGRIRAHAHEIHLFKTLPCHPPASG